jgi:hypothetical protein
VQYLSRSKALGYTSSCVEAILAEDRTQFASLPARMIPHMVHWTLNKKFKFKYKARMINETVSLACDFGKICAWRNLFNI